MTPDGLAGDVSAGMVVGLAAFLGLVIGVAAVVKLVDVDGTRLSLGRLAGRRRTADGRTVARRPSRAVLTTAAVTLGLGEFGLAGALLVAPSSLPVDVAVTIVCAGFLVVLRRARRLGTACGCFGSLSTRVPAAVELARGWALLAICAALLILRLLGPDGNVAHHGTGVVLGAGIGVLGAAAATGMAMAAAARVRSVRGLVVLLRGPRGPWRRPGPITRLHALRTAAAHPAVADVAGRTGIAIAWWRAQVRVTGRPVRITTIVAVHGDVRLQVLLPRDGAVAAIAYTPRGVVTPSRSG